MRSTVGRPRKLTDRQVKIIIAWHARYRLWRAFGKTLKTQRQLAAKFGASQATVARVVRLLGHYKQGSPPPRPKAGSGPREAR